MFENTRAFSGFSVNSIPEAKKFYGDLLGLNIREEKGMLFLMIPGGGEVFIYPKENHVPASFTILNFSVPDLKKTISELKELGMKIENTEKNAAWFKDPAGNKLSVLQDDSLKISTKIHLTKFIPDECSEIYRAWLDPSAIDLWAIPESTESYVEHFEPVTGGQFLIQHDTPRGIFESFGKFLEVIPNEKLSYELEITDSVQQNILKTSVVVEFVDEFSGTNVVLHQDGFETPDYLSICEKKWNDSLDKLHYVLTSDKFNRLAPDMHSHP